MNKIINLIVITGLVFTLFSCTKSTENSNSSPTTLLQPKLQFYGNGTLYNFDAVSGNGIGWKSFPGFIPSGNSVDTTKSYHVLYTNVTNTVTYRDDVIYLAVSKRITSTGIYTGCDKDNTYGHLGGTYIGKRNSTLDTIVVNSLVNGLASGTFVATLDTLNTSKTFHITNGTFSNLPIYK